MLRKEKCVLSGLKVGQSARIVDIFLDDKKLRNRFFEMGLTSGVKVSVKNIAPLGDPISISVRGYELSLRKSDLKNILVEDVKWRLLLWEIKIVERQACLML